jgi:hypothetical protein
MQALIGFVGQSIALLGLVVSAAIDWHIIAGHIHGGSHHSGMDRMARPVAVLFVALLTYRMIAWSI